MKEIMISSPDRLEYIIHRQVLLIERLMVHVES